MSALIRPARTKVALVGVAGSSRELAPYTDEEWDIWSITDLAGRLTRCDRWFEVHTLEDIRECMRRGLFPPTFLEWLAACQTPVYMQQHFPEYPASVAYPRDEMVAKYGRYFHTSTAWMLALAIEEGPGGPDNPKQPEEIGLWGMDFAVGDEYRFQRDSVLRLIGVAEGRGIKVTIPEQSALLKGYLYGYERPEDQARLASPLTLEVVRKRKGTWQRQLRDLEREMTQAQAILQELEHWEQATEIARNGGLLALDEWIQNVWGRRGMP